VALVIIALLFLIKSVTHTLIVVVLKIVLDFMIIATLSNISEQHLGINLGKFRLGWFIRRNNKNGKKKN